MSRTAILSGLSFFLLSVTPCLGQNSLEYGAKGGANFSTIQTSIASSSRLSGLAAGGLLMIDLDGPLAFQTELLYMERGNRDDPPLGNESTVFRLSYVEIPLFLRLQASLLGSSEAGLYAGPSPALKVRERLTGPGFDQNTDDLFKNYDFGVTFGVEFGFGVGNGRIILDARMTRGISKIVADTEVGGIELDPEANNHTFTLMSGFIFDTQ